MPELLYSTKLTLLKNLRIATDFRWILATIPEPRDSQWLKVTDFDQIDPNQLNLVFKIQNLTNFWPKLPKLIQIKNKNYRNEFSHAMLFQKFLKSKKFV